MRGARGHLEIDLHAELDDAVGWDSEVLRRGARVPRDEREERLAPRLHAAFLRGEERFATEKVARPAGRVGWPAIGRRALHDVGNVRRLHEPVLSRDVEKSLAELSHLDLLGA